MASRSRFGSSGYFLGSSPISGEGRPDFQEEVMIITEAIGHAFDHLDPVVDAFHQIGSQRPAAVGQDAK